MRTLIIVLLFAGLCLPAQAQKAMRIGSASIISQHHENELPTGLHIDGDIHARLFWIGDPHVQLGYSDLEWDWFTYEGRPYSRDELVRMFGDAVPDAQITDGLLYLEVQLGVPQRVPGATNTVSLSNCLANLAIDYSLSLELGHRSKMGTDLVATIFTQYTGTLYNHNGHDVSDSVADCVNDLDSQYRSAERWKQLRTDISYFNITDHYFPAAKNTLTTIEDRLISLLKGKADKEADEARTRQKELASRSGSGGGRKNDGEQSEDDDNEEKKPTPPHIKHLVLAQRFEQMGDYSAALREYNQYCNYPQALCDEDKRSDLSRKSTGQEISSLQRGLIDAKVSRPYDRPGFIADMSGSLGFLDFGDVGGGITFGVGTSLSHRFRNYRPTAILVELDADGRLGMPVMASMVGAPEIDPSLCGGDCAPDDAESWSTTGGRIGGGIDYRGFVALTYDLYARNFKASMPAHIDREYGGDLVWQEGLSLTIGQFEHRESEFSLRARSTGQLLMGPRTTDGPALSLVSYEFTMGYNQLTMRLAYQKFDYDPGSGGRSLDGSAFTGTMGWRLQ